MQRITNTFSYSPILSHKKVSSCERIEFVIRYDVPLYDQNSYNLCWAFCCIMIDDWSKGIYSSQADAELAAIELAKKVSGSEYENDWNDGGNNIKCIGNHISRHSINSIYDVYNLLLLGPIFTSYKNSEKWLGHAVVVTGVDTINGLIYVNNPWGISGFQTFEEFKDGFIGGEQTSFVFSFFCVVK